MPRAPLARSDLLWLSAILALALAARIPGLNAPLWYDEILTVERHLRLPLGEMMQGYQMNFHYLFNLLSKAAISVFGEQPWVIRLPALLFALGAIAAMWVLARDIAGTRIAHLVALLLAVSYHHIWFSQNARGYTGLAFFATLGMIFFLRGLDRPKPGPWIGYAVVLALAVFTHLTGAFLFVAQGLAWLALIAADAARGRVQPARVRLPLIAYVLGGVLTLLLYAPLLPSLLEVIGGVSQSSAVDVMVEYRNPLWSLLEGMRTGLGNLGPVPGIAAVLLIALTVLGGVAARRAAPLFAPVVALHIGLALVLLSVLGMRIWPRFFFADIGFVMLLVVLGLRLVSGWAARIAGWDARRIFLAASLAMVLVSLPLAARNYLAPKQNLVGALAYVREIRRPGERVYAVGYPAQVFNGFYGAGWGEISSDADYLAARAQDGPMLIVVAFPARGLRKVGALDADIGTTVKLVKRFAGTLGDGNVLVFRRE